MYDPITVTDHYYVMVTAFYPVKCIWGALQIFKSSHDLYLFIKIIPSSDFVLSLDNGKPHVQLIQTPSLAMTLTEGIFDGKQRKNPRAHVTGQHLEHAL